MNWLLNIFGAFLCFGLFVAFRRIGQAAASLPVGESWDEEPHESAADDTVRFRVVSDNKHKPIELKQF